MQLGSNSLAANLIDGQWMEPAAGRVIKVANPAIDDRSGRPYVRGPPHDRADSGHRGSTDSRLPR